MLVYGRERTLDQVPRSRRTPTFALLVALLLALLLGPWLAGSAHEQEASVRAVIADRAEAHGVSSWALTQLALCESRLDPGAVGDHGGSLGLFQLNTLPTGLYWHFRAVGYDDWQSAWQQADYVAGVAAGEYRGIRLSRWSCWR